MTENQIKIDLEGLFKDFHKDNEEISNLNKSWEKTPDLEDVFWKLRRCSYRIRMERMFKNRLGGSGKKMRKPSWIFDSRSITNSKEVWITGLKYLLIGDGTKTYPSLIL